MARSRCSQCHGYFDRDTFFRSTTMQRWCTEQCFNEWRERKRPSRTQLKAKKALKQSAPKTPIDVRFEVKERDGYNCRWCGRAGTQVHHCVYRSQGGTNEPHNLILLCDRCHGRAHQSKQAYQPLLLACLWFHYVEDKFLTIPEVANHLRSYGLLTDLQEQRLAS